MSRSPSPPQLRVRYYPRRVRRRSRPLDLTPGQALRLVDDPGRAARGRQTEELRELVEAHVAGTGRLRRWARRVLRRKPA